MGGGVGSGRQVLKLLKQIKMQESGEMEAPPITMPATRSDPDAIQAELNAMSDDEEDGGDAEDDLESSSSGAEPSKPLAFSGP